MAGYKFKIGETVYFHPKLPIDASRGAYQIIRRLPTAEGVFQYVIRSVNEDRQRVAKEAKPHLTISDVGTARTAFDLPVLLVSPSDPLFRQASDFDQKRGPRQLAR
jgi:hypothetical protein